MKLAILVPEPTRPWKRAPGEVRNPDVLSLRQYWLDFAAAVAAGAARRGHLVERIQRPMWEFDVEFLNGLGVDLALVPHAQREDLPGLETPAMFYMQALCRWLFTVDPNGWSAAAAGYPCHGYRAGDPNGPAFGRYRGQLLAGNESKFVQPPRRSRWGLWRGAGLPLRRYVFFPCQIPHDRSMHFVDRSEEEVIAALDRWATKRRIPVVFKEHPKNKASMAPLRAAAQGPFSHWCDASVHDLIRHAAAVYTLNSGVGFEALLHDKPVVTFGRVEYDAVTLPGDAEDLDGTWQRVQRDPRGARRDRHRRFLDWFTRVYAVDLADGGGLPQRIDRLVQQLESLAPAGAVVPPVPPREVAG